jgi:hypothetical protein
MAAFDILVVLEEQMDPITIMTHGHSTRILVHGKNLLALVIYLFLGRDMLPL